MNLKSDLTWRITTLMTGTAFLVSQEEPNLNLRVMNYLAMYILKHLCNGLSTTPVKKRSTSQIKPSQTPTQLKSYTQYSRMKQHIDLKETGTIKCDEPGCDYKLEDVAYANLHEHVNSTCPKCGSVLVTNQDYMKVMSLIENVRLINSLSPDEMDMLKKSLTKDVKDHVADQAAEAEKMNHYTFSTLDGIKKK